MSAPTDSFEMNDLTNKTTPITNDTFLIKDAVASNELKEVTFTNLQLALLADGTIVTLTGVQSLSNKTLVIPTILDFTNATHDHSNPAGGDQLTNTALVSGVFTAITGLGVQTQALDLAAQGIIVTSRATGDILKDDGTNLQRFPIGTANTVLIVNTGGTDLEYVLISDANISSTAEIDETKLANGIAGQFLRTDSAGTDVEWADDIASITFVIDGGGSVLTTGVAGDLEIPFNCTIERVTLLADQTGDVEIDLFVDTFVNYPPTITESIVDTTPPTITAADNSQDATLTSWTTALLAGSTIRYNVNSVATIQRVTIALLVRKTG